MSSSLSPTTRSRTSLFLSFRESRARSTRFARPRPRPRYTDLDDADDEHEGLIGARAHVAVDVNELPPPWVDLSDQVEDLLEDAKSKIASLEKLHSKHILPGFSDRSHEEREIEALTTNITKDFRRCHFLVQKIGSYQPHSFPPDPQSSKHQLHTAKNVQRGLAAKLQDLSATFRKKQRVYMEKLQGQATKNQDLLVASGAVSLKGSEGLSAVDDDIQAATHTRNQSMSLVHADPSVELRARDRELTEIANSIATLAELFKDLSALVIDQGTLLDSVEYNVEQTAVHLEGAVEELKVATKYQKNTGRRKCIFLLLLIIFGLIVVLIFKPKRHRSSTPPPPSSSPIASISLPPQARSETDAAASRRSISTLGEKGKMTSSVDGQRKAGEAPFYTSLNLNDSTNDLFYRPNQHARSPGLERAPLVEQSSPSTPITGRNTVSTNPNDRIDPTSQHVPFIYPPRPSATPSTPDLQSRIMASGQNPYDPERGQGYPPAVHSNAQASSSSSHEKVHDPNRPLKTHRPPGGSRASSWDLLGGIKKIEQSYEQFDTRNASQSHLVYADGDMPKNKLSKAYLFLLNASIVTRWFLFIVPVLGIIWIPGILSITKFPDARVWAVKLIWWSIWLTVVWAGWWAALAFSRIVPPIIRATLGTVAVGTRRYIEWMGVLHRYIAFFAWSIALWVSWQPLIQNRQVNPGDKSTRAVALIAKILFSLCICSAVLLFEKFAIQWIAGKFHERSYAERIADQKYAVKALVTLYRFSSDVPGRTDVLAEDAQTAKGSFSNPKRVFKKIREGVRLAATTTTTALGNVASEIAGSSVLQPNSPQAIVKTALESANKSRLLARRIFYSFARNGAEYMLVEDIQKYFPTPDEADRVFSLFDKDSNGDASREEVEMALMEFHREQLSIENSMRDLDSAVGRLDNILMSVYVVVALLIFAVALEAQLATIITGAGTLILGLSWLIGGSLQEVLTSIIFLFIKHPFDVGDRVVVNKETYTVKEIRLLSTVFLDGNSISVQAPNSQLNTLFIQNYRRSPQMSETFTFDVSYSTSFEDLERLREKMLEFVTNERRDYQPVFDVNIKDFPEQSKMTLSVDIKYKSNGQIASLKTKRRNKWICALKQALAEVMVYGPTGDPNPPPAVTRYTQVPWDTVLYEDQKGAAEKGAEKDTGAPRSPLAGSWALRDKNAVILDPSSDVFGDGSEVYMSTPQQERPEPNLLQQRYQQTHAQSTGPSAMPTAYAGMPAPSLGTAGQAPQAQSPFAGGESIELTPRRP